MSKTTEQIQKQIVKNVKRYLSENNRLLNKYRLKFMPIISFPQKRKLPLLGRFGIWLVKIQGGVLDIRFEQKQKE